MEGFARIEAVIKAAGRRSPHSVPASWLARQFTEQAFVNSNESYWSRSQMGRV